MFRCSESLDRADSELITHKLRTIPLFHGTLPESESGILEQSRSGKTLIEPKPRIVES